MCDQKTCLYVERRESMFQNSAYVNALSDRLMKSTCQHRLPLLKPPVLEEVSTQILLRKLCQRVYRRFLTLLFG